MKTTSYKSYKCNGFNLKYYSKSYIRDGEYYGDYVVAYYNGRRIVDRSTSEKRGLYDIICRLSDEERRRTTDAYIKENAARMGVAPCIVEAHIEEVQKKNSRAAVPAPKMEITAADIALYDYALGGAPVDGYTIGCADAVLKLMKKEGITPAAVDRARKKMKKQQPAPAAPVADAPADDVPAAPVADEQPAAAPSIKNADTPSNQKKQLAAWNGAVVEILEICAADNTAVVKIKGGSRTRIPADALEPTTAKKTTLPAWMMPGAVIDVKNAVRNDAPSTRHTIESVKATNIYYTDGTYSSINYIMHYGSPADDAPAAPVADAPAADEPDPDAIGEIVTIPANQKNAAADAAEQPAAPLVQAAKETGHLIVCSVPKAEQPAAPVVDAPAADAVTPANQKTETTPANQKTAADEYIETGAFPVWYNTQLECTSGNGVDFKVVSWGRKQVKVEYYDGQRRIYKVRDFINSVENGNIIVSAPYDAEYMAMLKRKQQQPAALTDADVLTAAARIKESYEAMKQQATADAYADAITAYCAALEEPAAPAWAPEVITVTPCPVWDDTPAADAAPAPRHRRRLNIAPRLSRWLHPARWVAVTFVVCLLSGLLLGMNTSTAADAPAAAADDIAAVYELHPVIITAALTDAPAAPSPVKKLAAPSPVKNAAANAVTLPNQKTASDIATATAPAADDADSLTTAPAANGLQPTPPDGLTICAGTAWAYTMMNWA